MPQPPKSELHFGFLLTPLRLPKSCESMDFDDRSIPLEKEKRYDMTFMEALKCFRYAHLKSSQKHSENVKIKFLK